MQAFGRSGASMIPVLNQGAEAVEAMRKATVMTPEEIRIAEGARRLTELIQQHMDEAGLTVEEREANVQALEHKVC